MEILSWRSKHQIKEKTDMLVFTSYFSLLIIIEQAGRGFQVGSATLVLN